MNTAPAPVPAPEPDFFNGMPTPVVVPAERAEDWLSRIKARWWLVAVAAVASVAAALLVTSFMPKQYAAKATVALTDRQPADILMQTGGQQSLDPERDVNTSLALVSAPGVVEPVRRRVVPTMSLADLQRELTPAMEGNSNIVDVTTTDRDPARAAAISNGVARSYVTYRAAANRTQFREAAASAALRLSALSPGDRAGQPGAMLRERINQLQTTAALQTPGAQLVTPATPPTSAASPSRRQAVVIALLIGVLLGCGGAILLGRRA